MRPSLTWLHVSDWHEGRSDFDRTTVLNALIDDIKRRTTLSAYLERLDFVFFTGDLAFSGKAEQYLKARLEFVDGLVKAAGVEKDRVFFVPGNHDVDRDELEILPPLHERLNSRQNVTRWLTSETRRRALLGPMRAFRDFCTDFYKGVAGREEFDPTYGYVKEFDIHGSRIAVLGLNSAWMCGHRTDGNEVNDYGYLILGEPQFSSHLPPVASAVDLRIALMHHPFWWFSFLEPRSRSRTRLIDNCDFILRGHEHEATLEVPSGETGRCAVISAGAAYDRLEFPNGYNFVHLDLEQRQGMIFLRRFEHTRSMFMADIALAPRTPGYLTFTLPKDANKPPPAAAQTSDDLSRKREADPTSRPPKSPLASVYLSGDKWSLQNQLTMQKLGEVYRLQHAHQKFHQSFSAFVVQADCLLPDGAPGYGGPDKIESQKVLKATSAPIHCLLFTLTISTEDDFAGDASWSVRFLEEGGKEGAAIDTIAVPVTDITPGTRQLLLFFDPIPQPNDPPFKVRFQWRVQNSLRLLKSAQDELFINPTRAEGPIDRMDLVLKYPISFGDIKMIPSHRERASKAGEAMTEKELTDYPSPSGYKTIGWTGHNLQPDKLFGVDLIPHVRA